MDRIKTLQSFGIKPYVIFDGDYLPEKMNTEKDRAKKREEGLKKGIELLKNGDYFNAKNALIPSIDVTPEMCNRWVIVFFNF